MEYFTGVFHTTFFQLCGQDHKISGDFDLTS